MSTDLPDSYDPKQPDLPTKAVDPDPLPDEATSAGASPTGSDTDSTDDTDDTEGSDR